MGFLDKAKQAANEMAAKADQAMANAGISGPAGTPGGMGANRAADAALRDFGLITWREAHGHPVDASEKERVLHTLQGLEAGGQLAPLRCTSPQGAGGLYGSPPPGAPPPPPGYAAQQAAAPTAPIVPSRATATRLCFTTRLFMVDLLDGFDARFRTPFAYYARRMRKPYH